MLLEGARNVTRGGKTSHQEKQYSDQYCAKGCDSAKETRAGTAPCGICIHGTSNKQRQRGINRHRIIFLRRRKREKQKQKAGPANCEQPGSSRAIRRFEILPRRSR